MKIQKYMVVCCKFPEELFYLMALRARRIPEKASSVHYAGQTTAAVVTLLFHSFKLFCFKPLVLKNIFNTNVTMYAYLSHRRIP